MPSEGNFSIQYVNGKFSHHQKTYRITSNEFLTKYLYYGLLFYINKIISNGTTVQRANINEWKRLINLINPIKINIQQKIIDIIEPIEKINNKLLNIKNKIIIFINKLEIKKTDEKNIFKTINTGKLNADAAVGNGKFNFYTCGERILKTNSSSFSGRNIILSGNGKIFTWIYNGIFDAYQRVYILKEKKDFYTTFYSLNKELDNLRQRSNGAVIKFIKKEDILSINKYSNSHEFILKNLYNLLLRINFFEENLKKLQQQLIFLLIK
ncbi:MAG: hypothetical protein REH79_01530 [Spiroplasma sp.]|nr:hypothetical protein [Spiroplasma sp.]